MKELKELSLLSMNPDDLFCHKCKRIKTRCICNIGSIKIKEENEFNELDELKFIFDLRGNISDEIVTYRKFNPLNAEPEIELKDVKIDERLKEILKREGIDKLYRFQVDAIEKISDRKNLIIVAPTGFGKTEAFTIPIIEEIYINGGKAIFFYPTKALARDQFEKIDKYASPFGLRVVKFDGDSTPNQRRVVLSGEADIILTNPDMVDYHLRNTIEFRKIVREVKFLVFDEFHSYSGLLGSNVSWLVKRLSRFSEFQIICSSATIANPKEFAEYLFEREFDVVKFEGRKSRLHFIMSYSPRFYSFIRDIVRSLIDKRRRMGKGAKILIFANSYKSAETIIWILNRDGIKARIHKGGLPKNIREEVERDFRSGKLKVVVATTTLELGIDVGDVDVVISELVPFPQFIQRSGRAGRKGQDSIGILILREDSISNYYRMYPERYFEDELFCYAEKMNEEVMRYHGISMIIEKPTPIDELPQELRNVISDYLSTNSKFLFPNARGRRFVSTFNMRGIGRSVKIYMDNKLIGERSLPMAVRELYPNSIFIHNGIKMRSVELDLERFIAKVKPYEGREITDPLYTSIPKVINIEEKKIYPVNSAYCNLEITITIDGYISRDVYSNEKLDVVYLDEQISYTFKTKGFVMRVPFPDYMDYDEFYSGSFHALEHVLIESTNPLTGGSNYMGGISTPNGDIFVYDSTQGGSGLSKLLFIRLDRALEIAKDVMEGCDCKRIDGCPKCTYSYQCGNDNYPLNRIGAINIIKKIQKGERRELNIESYDVYYV